MYGIGVDWRVVVVGGHTRNIGKTQLVCDLIAALPEAEWIAGKITQYGHGVCAQNGAECDCAPDDPTAPTVIRPDCSGTPEDTSKPWLGCGCGAARPVAPFAWTAALLLALLRRR